MHLHVNADGRDVIIIPTIGMKGNYNSGGTVCFTFGGNVAHVLSKETEKNVSGLFSLKKNPVSIENTGFFLELVM